MGLKLIRDVGGTYRRTWYATMRIEGKLTSRVLHIPVRGKIPVDASGRFSLRIRGDDAFEKSKAAAMTALSHILDSCKDDPAHLEKIAYNKATGSRLVDVPLSELPKRWRLQPKRRGTSETWLGVADTYFERFAKFARSQDLPKGIKSATTVNGISQELAQAYLVQLEGEYSHETVKKQIRLLSSAYELWATSGRPNPFAGFFGRNDKKDEIPHEPFSRAQLDRILELTEEDPLVHALAVTAAFTGMRIGDVCRLRWEDVNLDIGVISIVTSKAKVLANIPILDERFSQVLNRQIPENGHLTGFVFPLAAELYESKQDAVTKSIKPFIARALFERELAATPAQIVDEKKKPANLNMIRDAVLSARMPAVRRERILDTYTRFRSGASYSQIQSATGRARSVISSDLHAVEMLTGESVRPRKALGTGSKIDLLRLTQKNRERGCHAASLYGWHSFRTTFVTLAIEAGISPTDIGQIVGHTTAKMTLRYYKPRLKHFADRIRQQLYPSQGASATTKPPVLAETPQPAVDSTLATTIQAILSNPDLTAETRNAAILALTVPKK